MSEAVLEPAAPIDTFANQALTSIRAAQARFPSDPARDCIERARRCAEQGDGAGVNAAFDELAVEERFVAALSFGAIFPAVCEEVSRGLEAYLHEEEARWDHLCSEALTQSWARVALEGGLSTTVIALLPRAHRGSAGRVLIRLIGERCEARDVAVARKLTAAVRDGKGYQAVARAALGLGLGDDELLRKAVRTAVKKPYSRSREEELHALIDLLDFIGSREPNHPEVEGIVARICANRHGSLRSPLLRGAARAARICERIAEEHPDWRRHIERLAQLGPLSASGNDEYHSVWYSPRPWLETTAQLRECMELDVRARGATRLLARSIDEGDLDGAIESLIIAIEAPSGEAPTNDERLLWAATIRRGDFAARGLELLVDALRSEDLDIGALRAELPELDVATGEALLPLAAELGLLAGTYSNSEKMVAGWAPFATSPELEAIFFRGLNQGTAYAASAAIEQRGKCLRTAVRARADRTPLNDSGAETLERWAASLVPTDRPALAAATSMLGPLGLSEALRLCVRIDAEDAAELCEAFASSGRIDDALRLADSIDVGDSRGAVARQRALVAIASAPRDADLAILLLKRFRSSPTGGQGLHLREGYRFRLSLLQLRLGQRDESLDTLETLRGSRDPLLGRPHLALLMARHFVSG